MGREGFARYGPLTDPRLTTMLNQLAALILVTTAAIACGRQAMPTAPTAGVPTTVDLKSSLSTAFDALSMSANAACSLSISLHGQVLLERGRGLVAAGRAADADSLYRIASLTKPITASAVLISEQAGRLSRTDKINRFLAYPEPAPTIDELIKHIPGLPNYLETAAYQSGRTSPTTVETLLSLIQPWDGVRRYQYSNSHAILSGAALQKVNGLRYEEVVQRDIFGPAGMSRSSFTLPSASESLQLPFATHPSWSYAAGGITSSAADLNRFNQALLNNLFGFGSLESLDRSPTGVTSFGMGSAVNSGELRFGHAGVIDTYSSYSIIFPADRSSVVVLCNLNGTDIQALFTFIMSLRSSMLAAR
jgi:CubicO group peptidase (beta-lactamase class C family)